MDINMLKCKIHNATVTEANLNYVGSITIDSNLLEKCGLLEYEKVQVVNNNNGGTAVEADWTLLADGPTPISGPGAPGATDVQSGVGFQAGTYNLSESAGPAGYTASSWDCVGGGSLVGSALTLALNESATCTIINDDDGVGLTLNKVVINNNGGTAVDADWNLFADGPTPISGPAHPGYLTR